MEKTPSAGNCHATMNRFLGTALLLLGLAAAGVACAGGEEAPATPTPSPAAGAGPATPTPEGNQVSLTWYGHSMFLLTSPGGTTILTDPNSGIGYEKPELPKVDAVVVSHDHFDHNKAEVAGSQATVLAGVKDGDWANIDETIGDVRIRSIPTYHDDKQGAERGKNSMFLFEAADMRILFAGDLGHVLTEEQVAAVGQVDILILPVGGYFTIGPAEGTRVVEQLKPRVAVPMHYQTDVVRFKDSDKLAGVEPFLEGKTVRRIGSNTLVLEKGELPSTTTVVVMEFR